MTVPAVTESWSLADRGASYSRTSLELPADLSYEGYEEIGGYLGQLRDATAWWIGDWLVFGESAFTERSSQAAEATGRSPRTLTSYSHVSMYVHPQRRRVELSWSHHRLVAMLPPGEQKSWLAKAVKNRWSVAEMQGAMQATKEVEPGEPKRGEVQNPDLYTVALSVLFAGQEDGDGFIRVPVDTWARFRAVLEREER